jgi:acylphosphatase
MKIKIKITGGKVHGVGYRSWLIDVAVNAGLHGFYAGNRIQENNSVIIVLAEGDEESLSFFEGQIRSTSLRINDLRGPDTLIKA